MNNSQNIKIKHSGIKYKNWIDWRHIPDDKFKNSILTHNHPNGSGLSLADIKLFVYMQLREVRAVTANGTVYSMKNIGINSKKRLDLIKTIKNQEKFVDNIYGNVDASFKDALVFKLIFKEMAESIEYVKYI
ncbi:hypothetical protein [Kordia jejudonensis]|uniref:hypothetical protein n=1 Tax=Kordia jejudonensis TaxID=1348245 RepID=UPI0006295DD3|nr:hypothetical protein [Kordia jejudonensis]